MRRDTAKASKSLKISISSDEIMLPIYKGIPELFEYVLGLVERRPKRDAESIVAFNLLREILKATEHAIIHYFALSLSEPFLQNSQDGPPYQKWARVTNENFQKIDQYVKTLQPIIQHLLCPQTVFEEHVDGFKKIDFLFCRLNREYACCKVNLKEPFLTISAISFDWWLNTADGSVKPTPKGTGEYPPIAIKSVIPIADRSVLKNLQSAGINQVAELRRLLTRLAAWLDANYTLSDFTVVPAKNQFFYKHWMENRGQFD